MNPTNTNINDLSLNQLAQTNKKTIYAAQQQLLNIIEQNNQLFVNSIRKNDLPTAISCDNWGLDWTSKKLWKDLLIFPNCKDITLETFKFLESVKVNDIVPEYTSNSYYGQPVKVIVPQDRWNKEFKNALESSFGYHRFLPEVNLYIIEQYPDFLNDKNNKINPTLKSFINYFYLKNISEDKYQAIHEYLLDNHLTKLSHIFTLNLPIENFDYLLAQPRYNKIFQQFIKNNEIKSDKQSVFHDCFMNGNIGLIKYWHTNGFTFPIGKELYSHLFATIKNLGAIEYVCKNIEDITINKQVILKTVLHYNLADIVPLVLEQYSKEQLQQLPLALQGREHNEAVAIAQKTMKSIVLEDKILHKDTSPKLKN